MYITICKIEDMKQSTQSECSGTTQKGVGWGGKGGGSGVQAGRTRTSVTDSCRYMAKTTTILGSN